MKIVRSAVLALVFCWNALPLSALEVRQFVWGYDNQVVPGTFNPLSVLVSNPSETPFDGQLELAAGSATSLRGGERAVAACYLAPGTARWVQFYPFFDNSNASGDGGWVILWGKGKNDQFELDPPKLAGPARVWLADPDDTMLRATANLRRFPDNLFPPTVTATDGLATVVLDHAPRWEPARRTAFLDWVRRGGIVHLLPDEAGAEVNFTDELTALNAPVDQQRVGRGLVVRHHGNAVDLRQSSALLVDDPAPPTLELSGKQANGGQQVVVYDLENAFFRQLARPVAPHVNWGIIYWLTFFYILAVGPVHYFWTRRRRDYRVSLAAFIAGVTVFALAFGWVGRRGLGESDRVLTLAWARSLEDGSRYDVMQWSNAFVTRGGDYTLTHPAPYNLYSSNNTADVFSGRAASGLGGRYFVELPLFSSCALVHRGVMTGDPIPTAATNWDVTDGQLRRLSLPLPAGFPTDRFLSAYVRFHERFYPLHLEKEPAALVLNGGPQAADTFLSNEQLGKVNAYYSYRYGKEADASPTKTVFENCERALIARSLGGTEAFVRYVKSGPLPGEQADLLLLLDNAPDSFHMSGVASGHETARVLYQRTFFQP